MFSVSRCVQIWVKNVKQASRGTLATRAWMPSSWMQCQCDSTGYTSQNSLDGKAWRNCGQIPLLYVPVFFQEKVKFVSALQTETWQWHFTVSWKSWIPAQQRIPRSISIYSWLCDGEIKNMNNGSVTFCFCFVLVNNLYYLLNLWKALLIIIIFM